MANYIAVDAGGTKVAAILYDENFKPLRRAKVGSMRSNTTSPELVEKNASDLVEQLGITENTVINRVAGIYDRSLISKLNEVCTVEEQISYGELGLGLYAAGIFGDGILSLSGTGATTFAKFNGKEYMVGGYGAIVSDEGSGYWMSREALNYAIKDFEGRGEKTLLTEFITKHFERDNLHDAIFSIYGRKNVSPASSVASCAPLVEKAAYAGDRIALKIIEATGASMADQLMSLMRMYNIPGTVPVTVSGSIWKGHELMFSTYKNKIENHDKNIKIILPDFEPIVGSVIGHFYQVHGKFDSTDKEFFKQYYSEYLFNVKR
ncbi:MAG: hypothetical protein E7672_02930 [Ruminococcaceae bacterium]|nr:hypothetical protein [Oscillospiraceae bacterium]